MSLFSIVPATGVVSLAGSLDYNGLSGFYQLKIIATVSIWLQDEFVLHIFTLNDTNKGKWI